MNANEKETLYTIRWYAREQWGDPAAQSTVIDLLGDLLEREPVADSAVQPQLPFEPAVVPSSDPAEPGGLLWCPFAETDFPPAPTRGRYEGGYPKGAVVHFTAGRRSGLAQGLRYQVGQGYCYFLIDADGRIGQNFPLDRWGYHAGRSYWRGLKANVSDSLVGIEIQAAGMLEGRPGAYQSWFRMAVPDQEVRVIASTTANQQVGPYQAYTQAQEAALTRLLLWLHANRPDQFDLDLVLGHDEVSPERKNDPGGALSRSMPDYRQYLKAKGGVR